MMSTVSFLYAEPGKMQREQGKRLQKDDDCLMVKTANTSPSPQNHIHSNYSVSI